MLLIFLLVLPPQGYHTGWPMHYPNAMVSTGLTFADITGDGHCEVITQLAYPGYTCTLYVYNDNGNLLWSFGTDTIMWLPAFGDLDNDLIDELVVGCTKGLYAFDGNGQVMSGFPIYYPGCWWMTCAIADIDNDTSVEIIYTVEWHSDSGMIFVSDRFGQPLSGWPITTPFYGFTQPAVADIDNDGYKEVIINTWLDSLRCYRYDGSQQPGFPVPCLLTQDCGPSEIIVCDLDHDNYLEILVGSCTPWADTGCLFIYRYNGIPQPNWPQYFSNRIVFNPEQYHFAVGDLNNDQEIEILITGTGRVMRILDRFGNYLPGSGQYYSRDALNPVIANIDYTPEKEFIVQSSWSRTTAFCYNGELCMGWPIQNQGGINWYNSITVDDIDNDGMLELGVLAGWSGKTLHIWDIYGDPSEIEWGCPYFDIQRTCYYR